MQIPRSVPAMYLPTAARGELLVKCEGRPGSEFTLASGYGPAYEGLGGGCDADALEHCRYYRQRVVAVIRLASPSGEAL